MKKPVESIMPYIEEIAHRIDEPEKYGAVSIMVGAGFSKNAICIDDTKSTPPDWAELSEKMFIAIDPPTEGYDEEKYKKNKVASCSGRNVLSLAQKYEVAFDRVSLNHLIEDSISDASFIPGELHKKLLKLNWHDVFTTNYDTLLERTLGIEFNIRNYKIIYSQNDLPGSVSPRIIKLHGSFGHNSDYIITEEDYRTYPVIYAPFVNTVQQAMIETRLCLIGFSGDDPNFLNWLGWLRDNLNSSFLPIYLCGAFDTMSVTDKKLIEQRGIKIIDLSLLVDHVVNNIHYDSLNAFLDAILSINKNKHISIIDSKPQPTDRIIGKLKNNNGLKLHYKDVYNYAQKVAQYISNYACIPVEESRNLSNYFYNELRIALNENEIDNKPEYIDTICFILLNCHSILFDSEASKLKDIIFHSDILYNNIMLLLLKMYRIDGDYDNYTSVETVVKNKIDFISSSARDEFYIEFAKYYLSILKLEESNRYVQAISSTSNEIVRIKKASLLVQMNKPNEAVEILKQTKGLLSQKRFSDKKTSSLLGYINLVYRSTPFYINEEFSDEMYYNNEYNCRRVINEMQTSLISTIFQEQVIISTRSITFNPNSYRKTVSVGKQLEDKAVDKSFNYILLNDQLCLCHYGNQKEATIQALDRIINTSVNPLWKWNRVFLMADVKTYETYFTRKSIYKSDIKWIIKFYDSILCLIEERINSDNDLLRNMNYTCLFDMASRLSIVLDESKIIQLIDVLFDYFSKDSNLKECKSICSNVLNKLKISINENVLKNILSRDPKILIQMELLSHLSEKENFKLNSTIKNDKLILQSLSSKETETRNFGIDLYQLYKSSISTQYREKIEKKLWSQLDEYGFPKNDIYLPTIWIKDEQNDLESKYKDFIIHPKIPREMLQKGVYSASAYSIFEISTYYRVFFKLIRENMINTLNSVDICNLLSYFKIYLDNEKDIMKMPPFFQGYDPDVKFVYLVAIVYLLLWYAKKNGFEDNRITDLGNDIINECNLANINCYEISSLVNNFELSKDLQHYESEGLKNNRMVLLYQNIWGKIKLGKKPNQDIKQVIDFLDKNSYMDVKSSSIGFINAEIILDCIPQKRNTIKRIIKILENCYDRYEKIVSNTKDYSDSKACLNGMYNISSFTRELYLTVKKVSDNEVLFDSIIQKFRNNKLNEINMSWK